MRQAASWAVLSWAISSCNLLLNKRWDLRTLVMFLVRLLILCWPSDAADCHCLHPEASDKPVKAKARGEWDCEVDCPEARRPYSERLQKGPVCAPGSMHVF